MYRVTNQDASFMVESGNTVDLHNRVQEMINEGKCKANVDLVMWNDNNGIPKVIGVLRIRNRVMIHVVV